MNSFFVNLDMQSLSPSTARLCSEFEPKRRRSGKCRLCPFSVAVYRDTAFEWTHRFNFLVLQAPGHGIECASRHRHTRCTGRNRHNERPPCHRHAIRRPVFFLPAVLSLPSSQPGRAGGCDKNRIRPCGRRRRSPPCQSPETRN